MNKQKCSYKVVGVMSGTSLDGLDLCLSEFNLLNNKWSFQILDAVTLPYDITWTRKLKNAPKLSGLNLVLLSNEYGKLIGKEINKFIKNRDVDFISSHGHTVFHQTEKQLTYQIGNGAFIAAETKKTCVCDFRSYDLALNGQGAPLVPIGDKILFSEYDGCLNLGGFANISHTNSIGQTIAFDICPVNVVLNKYANLLGYEFDNKGSIAKSNSVNQSLLEKLNNLSFYQQNHPKSLGLEWVEEHIFPLINSTKIKTEEVLATFTKHIAIQLNATIKLLNINNLLVTGGGTYNSYLIDQLEGNIYIGKKELIDFKEALIFAFLGVLRIRNEKNVLNSITGAERDSISGQLFLA